MLGNLKVVSVKSGNMQFHRVNGYVKDLINRTPFNPYEHHLVLNVEVRFNCEENVSSLCRFEIVNPRNGRKFGPSFRWSFPDVERLTGSDMDLYLNPVISLLFRCGLDFSDMTDCTKIYLAVDETKDLSPELSELVNKGLYEKPQKEVEYCYSRPNVNSPFGNGPHQIPFYEV